MAERSRKKQKQKASTKPEPSHTNTLILGIMDDDESDESDELSECEGELAIQGHEKCDQADEGAGDFEEVAEEVDEAVTKDVYKETDEALPVLPVYDPRSIQIVSEGNEIVASVQKLTKQMKGSQTKGHQEYADRTERAARGPQPERLVYTLAGPAGVGKSCLVSALIGIPGVSKSICAGEACTAVPVLYTAATPNQKKQFAITVDYYSELEISAIIAEQLENYYHYESMTKKGRRIKDKSLEDIWKPRHATAIKTFRALFCDRKAFRSHESVQTYLKLRGPKAKPAIHAAMVDWCKKISSDRKPQLSRLEGFVERYDAGSVSALRKVVDRLTTAGVGRSIPAPWPIVKQVSIACKGSVILTKISILDIPGVADTNRVRVQTAMENILQSDHLLLVANLARITDDATLNDLLSQFSDRFQGKIAIVATKCDVDAAGLQKHYRAQGEDFKGFDLWQDIAREADQAAKTLEHAMSTLPESCTPATGRAMFSKLRDHQNVGKSARAKMFEFLVDMRNRVIQDKMEENTSADRGEADHVPFFPVSSTHYAAHKGVDDVDGPLLGVRATGIPALRTYLIAQAATSHETALTQYLDYDLGFLITGLMLYGDGSEVKSVGEIRGLLNLPSSECHQLLDVAVESLTGIVQMAVEEPLNNQNVQKRVSAETVSIVAEWRDKKWHWQTVKSFVRNHGANSNSVKPNFNWNKGLCAKVMADIVLPAVHDTDSASKVAFIELEAALRQKINNIGTDLQRNSVSQTLPLSNFLALVRIKANELLHSMKSFKADYTTELAAIQLQAVKNMATGYFVDALGPAYTASQAFSGKGVKRRVLNHIQNYVLVTGRESVFAELGRLMAAAMRANIQQFVDKTNDAVESAMAELKVEYDNSVFDQANVRGNHKSRDAVKAFLAGDQIVERYKALLAKRDEIFADPKYASVQIKRDPMSP